MGKLLGFLAKAGSALTGGAVLAGGGAAAENYVNGENSWTRQILRDTFAGVATSQTDAGVQSSFHGFFKFIELVAQMIQRSFGCEGPISNALGNWAQRNMGRPETFGNGDINDNTTPAKTVSVGNAPDVTKAASSDLDVGDGVSVAAGAVGYKYGPQVVANIPKLATIAPKIAVRGIPVVASFAAAADTLWDTSAYMLKGEFGNAATRFAGGTVETAAGLGGVFTYAAGVAARDAIEKVSNAQFGTDVPEGELAHYGKTAINWLTNSK